MQNDDVHLNMSSNQINYSMQDMNSAMNQNDDNCIDLLEMINMDDNTSNVLMDSCNINQGNMDGVDTKEEDRFYQEIMSALEKKDFKKIATLALSQSHGGKIIGTPFNEALLAIEKSEVVDTNVIEKLTNIIRAQPKSSASVLRATVAPIRNESIVSNSSTSIANYAPITNTTRSKSSSQVTRCSMPQEYIEQDWQTLLSPEIKTESNGKSHGSRSLPATPPISQVPSRPLSSSCVPHKVDQGYSYQNTGANGPMSYVQFSNQSGHMMLHGGYGGSHMAQNVGGPQMQYQPNFLSNNGIVCFVTPSIPGEHVTQAPANNYPFLVPQNVLFSVSSGAGSSQSGQSVASTCAMTTGLSDCTKPSSMIATTTPMTSSSTHCSNLPRILPKPGNRIIAPKTQYSQQFITPSSMQLPQQQQFKRPSVNRRSNSRPKPNKNSRASKTKDNIMMAWEIAEQSLPCEDQPSIGQSFLTQLEGDEIGVMQGSEGDDLHMLSGPDGGVYSHTEVIDQFVSADEYEQTEEYGHYDPNMQMNNEHINNILAGFEELLEGLNHRQYIPITVVGTIMEGACVESNVQYGRVTVMCIPPLARAIVTKTAVSNRCVVVSVSKPNTVQSDIESTWSGSSNDRMVQLLCAHLGSHSGILTPLLKCLLPSSDMHDLGEPLSVSTRISEQDDMMTEEDLLADISPVKRDPFHLANLDRLLESCQPPSSVASNNSSITHQQHVSGHVQLSRMPYSDVDDSLLLQSFVSATAAQSLLWLKKANKHKNKWTIKDNVVQTCRSLEVPPVSGEKAVLLLRKKSNYQEKRLNRIHVNPKKSDKYRRRMDQIRESNNVKQSEPQMIINSVPETSSGLLKIRIHLAKSDASMAVVVRDIEPAKPIVTHIDSTSTALTVDTNLSTVHDHVSKNHHKTQKKTAVSKGRGNRSRSGPRQTSTLSDLSKHSGHSSTKRIFCTRKEDRRSSVLQPQSVAASPTKLRHIPTKKKRNKVVSENPPIIMKLSSRKPALEEMLVPLVSAEIPMADEEPETQTSDSIKLFIKRSGQNTYKSQILSVDQAAADTPAVEDNISEEAYQYSPAVNLAPPSHHQRSRPQQAVLQFSPAHSSSDSDIGVAHNEISSLLQRQEQREPLSDTGAISRATFPSLPVPYLIGTDPSVFMDPHEIELVVVKNSRYKKVCQRQVSSESQVASNNLYTDANNTDVFVPGCFVEQDKTSVPWSRSSPSMPILAPQEPFTVAVDANKSSHISNSHSYSQASASQLQPPPSSQSFSEHSDRTQQSPLCMATTNATANSNNNPQNSSQYSSSSNQLDLMPPDPIKSPPYRHPSYHYQSGYNSSCYLGDSNNPPMIQPTLNSSKSQMQSPGLTQQISVSSACSSQIPDYQYFQNSNQQSLQSLMGTDTSSLYQTPSSYQSVPPEALVSNHQASNTSKSKRSSTSSRANNQSCDHQSSSSATSKKRKESSGLITSSSSSIVAPSNQVSMYPSDLYNAAAHYQDYYGSGFSNLLGMDQIKLYEQYAREYSLQFSSICPPNMHWSSAMAEYYKQAMASNPAAAAAGGTSPTGIANTNPLSSSSGLQNGTGDYSNPYSAYAMSQPYSMYSNFGLPK